ncbi:hypothetical protein [Breoghania sp. JC706]|uniref:helix-turn-helix transcriptional regulator n=1 Tax=Breoghania sp. JC706 TaxID=3117732 RepID=UPI003009780F
MAIDGDRLDRAVTGFYEAAIDPSLWRPAVQRFADLVGAQSTHIMAFDTSAGTETIGFLDGVDGSAYQGYLDTYLPHDIRVPRLLAAPVGKVLRNPDIWTREERLSSLIYNEFQKPNRIFEITGAQLGMEGHLSWFGVGRCHEVPFSEEEVAAIRHVVLHVRQALRIALAFHRERTKTGALADLWSRSGRGVLVLSTAGVVLHVNEAAEAMRRAGVFRLASDRLVLPTARLAADLAGALEAVRAASPQAALQSATCAGHEAGLLVGGLAGIHALADGEQIGIRFLPVLKGAGADGSALVVVLVPLAREPLPGASEISQFAGLFSLSASEEAVIAAVAQGIELSDHARARGIALDTARKHLKSALSKTGCRSQKMLVRLIERFCFLRLR